MRGLTSVLRGRKNKLRVKRCVKRNRRVSYRLYSEHKTTEDVKMTPEQVEAFVSKTAPGYENYSKFIKEKVSDHLGGKLSPSASDLETRYYIARKLLESLGGSTAQMQSLDSNYKKLNSKQQAALDEIMKKREEIIVEFYNKNKNADLSPILGRLKSAMECGVTPLNEPVRVAITGGAGQIGYALIFRIASGAMFGPHTPVILHLLEIPDEKAMKALKGVAMELEDCAFPLVRGIVTTDSPEKAFEGVDWALLVGAKPRTGNMERSDLLKANAAIFSTQGQALNKVGKGKNTRVVIVGNPANTNAMITSVNAPRIPPENIAAMTRLDQNRAAYQLAAYLKADVKDLHNIVIWGNHSATQFPDISHGYLKDKLLTDLVTDNKWLTNTFIPNVQKRGAEVIKAKEGKSSAASAASALVDTVKDWHCGTNGKWASLAVASKGEYGVTKGLFYSYPVIHSNKSWDIVKDLPIDSFAAEKMEATHKELLQERDAVASLLK